MATNSSDWQRYRDLSKSITFYLSPEDAERLAEARRCLRAILVAKARRLQEEGVPKSGQRETNKMHFTCSKERYGLTVSLTVSTSAAYPAPLCEDLSATSLTEDLVSSAFDQAQPQFSAQLGPVFHSIDLILQKSLSTALHKEIEETNNGNEQR